MNIPATPAAHEPAIHVRGLEKSFKTLKVLRGVDLDVTRGSILALLGSNGAGKTTMVKILATLLRADTGTARVNGLDVATQPAEVRASISLTGQFAAVDEILTGRENLVLVARLRHLSNPGAIVDDLLRRFSLTDLLFDLVDLLAVESDPRARRLHQLMRERGWTGWNRMERLREPSD